LIFKRKSFETCCGLLNSGVNIFTAQGNKALLKLLYGVRAITDIETMTEAQPSNIIKTAMVSAVDLTSCSLFSGPSCSKALCKAPAFLTTRRCPQRDTTALVPDIYLLSISRVEPKPPCAKTTAIMYLYIPEARIACSIPKPPSSRVESAGVALPSYIRSLQNRINGIPDGNINGRVPKPFPTP
jgi:hypothetical protein